MAHLEIRLFGALQISLNGEPVPQLRSEKARALLTYLAVETDQVHRREKLAGLLWPDFTETSARTNLRRALSDLRAAIGDHHTQPPFLLTTRQTIRFNTNSDAWVDASVFSTIVGCSSNSATPVTLSELDIDQLEGAIGLYQGPFLAQFSLPDSAGYEEWLLLKRERFHRLVLEAIHCLTDQCEKKGEVDLALHYAWRQLELDPWQENAQRQLMRLLVLDGRRDAALAQFETYCQELFQELDSEPSQETRHLYESIRRGEWPGATFSGTDIPVYRPPKKLGACPYQGLNAFRAQDAPFFYGRERFIVRLREAVLNKDFLALIGPSGSGKTSVLKAGLITDLHEREETWLTAICRPGDRPFRSLAATLLSLRDSGEVGIGPLSTAQDLADAWRMGTHSLREAAEHLLRPVEKANRLLLIIDQFEEIYTQSAGYVDRQKFLDFLLLEMNEKDEFYYSPVSLLIALRADFMGEALSYRPLADLLQERSLMLGPMTRDELKQAIVKPAKKQGATFVHGLVERLLEDVGEAPGCLPLLEFTLTLLWDSAESGWLTHEAYSKLGGVDEALTKYAEQVYGDLNDGDKEKVPHILSQLVQPVEGLGDTRRIATRSEIGEGNWALTRHLADKRLIVTGIDEEGNETAELVHEVLINKWDRLQGWLARYRGFRLWQQGLRFSQRQWVSCGKDDGALLRGIPLSRAADWLEIRGDELSQREKDFIRASLVYREHREAEREVRRERQRAAEHRARRLKNVLWGVFALSALITVLLVNFTMVQRQVTRESHSRSLAASARESLRNGDTRLGLSLALAANEVRKPSQEVKRVLFEAAHAPGARWSSMTSSLFGPYLSPVTSLDLDPYGKTALLGLGDGTIIHWDIRTNQEVKRFKSNFTQGRINDIAFGPHGVRALFCGEYGSLFYWDVSQDEVLWLETVPVGACRTVDISPDGRLGLTGGLTGGSMNNPGTLILWDLETGKILKRYEGHIAGVISAKFTPDGNRIVASSGGTRLFMQQGINTGKEFEPHDLLLRVVSSGDVVWKWLGEEKEILTVDISPDGDRILTGSYDGSITLWSIESGKILRSLSGHRGPVNTVAFTPSGERALSGSGDGSLILWGLESGEALVKFDVHDSDVVDLSIGPHGRTAISVSYQGEIIRSDLWNSFQGLRIEGPEEVITDVASSPDGRRLLSISSDVNLGRGNSILRLWESRTGEQLRFHKFSGRGSLTQVAVSPDGQTALLAGKEPEIIVWDLKAWEEVGLLKGHTGSVMGVVFTPDGKQALSIATDGKLLLWDMTSRMTYKFFYQSDSALRAVAINPDGSRVVTVTGNSRFVLMDLEDGEKIRQFSYPLAYGAQGSTDLAFLSDGRRIISCQKDGKVIEWDVKAGESVRILGEHDSPRTQIVLNPDSDLAMTSGEDGSLKMWDLREGRLIYEYDVHSSIHDLTIAPDGKSAYFGTSEGTIIQWLMINPTVEEVKSWVKENRYVPELTCDEREKYQVKPLCKDR